MVATEPWYKSFNSNYDAGNNIKEPAYTRSSPSEVAGRMDADLATNKVAKATKEDTPKLVASRIRVQLSRPLTWAEKEALETNNLDVHSRRINDSNVTGFKFHVSSNKEHVWAEAFFGSRLVYDLVAAALEQHFVNVYPTAVRTFREYNGE